MEKNNAKIPKKSVLLYFGDSPNKKKPDVCYLFEKTHKLIKNEKKYK